MVRFGSGAAKSVTQLECIAPPPKKRGTEWVSLFCSEMAHGALRSSLTPPTRALELGMQSIRSLDHPLTTPTEPAYSRPSRPKKKKKKSDPPRAYNHILLSRLKMGR